MSGRSLSVTQTALVFLGVMVGLAAVGEGAGILVQRAYDLTRRPDPVTQRQAERQVPPEPRLEIDLLASRRTVVGPERRAESFGWTDRGKGRAHVPVDVAMSLLARQGWPTPGEGS